jgi:tripartite ATP-independent transporter DctM subunit
MVSLSFFLVAMGILVVLMLGGMWIAFAIGIGGVLSLYPFIKESTAFIFGAMSWENGTDMTLAALPLFIFMGEIISGSGMVERLYRGASKAITGVPGGLVQTNIFACTIFAACSGSSIASAATMSRVAYPEQVLRRGYNSRIVLGSLTGGGTLGILIPPSIFFIIYCSLAEQSVAEVYLAGVVPGLILSLMFMGYVAIRSFIQPKMFPKELEASNWRTRLSGIKLIWPFLLLITAIMGSLYGGIATPTEAAAVGAAVSVLIAVFWRLFTWKGLITSGLNTVKTNCMIFFILINAKVVAVALGYYGLPAAMQDFAQSFKEPVILLILISVVYIILGTIFEDFSLILLMLPFVIPLIRGSEYNMVWFGVYMVIMLQAGLLSPPVGVVLFVVQGITGAHFKEVVWGSIPFAMLMILLAAIIVVEPKIVLWLPGYMGY